MIQHWSAILGYATVLVFIFQGLYVVTKEIFGPDSAILTNLILTGFFVMIVKALAMKADRQAKTA